MLCMGTLYNIYFILGAFIEMRNTFAIGAFHLLQPSL